MFNTFMATNITNAILLHPIKTNLRTITKSSSNVTYPRFSGSRNYHVRSMPRYCKTTATAKVIEQQQTDQNVILRRSGNYGSPTWSFDSIQSLHNAYSGEIYVRRANELKEKVELMLKEDMKMLDCLELVDNLERLGIDYHFQPQIDTILSNMYNIRTNGNANRSKDDLYAVALEFRVFRQHGFNVSQDVFNPFMNEDGDKFDVSLVEDTKGMLALYEACFLLVEGETKLELAREFTIKHLKKVNQREQYDVDPLVQHALALPLRWRVPRIEARWHIDAYERSPNMNPILLEFAKLDYNIVQSIHQEDLKEVARWWRDIQIGEKWTFVRDRVVENFFWTVGVVPEPHLSDCRIMLAKVFILINILDDLYDVYGTLEELEIFTNVVERWDVKIMDELPEYTKVGFLGFFNSVNEMAYDALKEQGVDVVEYLRKVWVNLCKAYMQEARWYYSGYTPTCEEYLKNAEVSISTPVMLMHVYTVITNPVNKEAMDCLDTHSIVRWSSYLLRLADDLGTSEGEMKRGDVAKIMQCHMKETGGTQEEAREYLWYMLRDTWKKMNSDCMAESPFGRTFKRAAKNFGRVALLMYEHGDGHGLNCNPEAENGMMASLFTPVPVPLQ